ncbi:MAG: molybdopterin-dependent oxidoreductase [Chitinophagaceae bacterium]|nr:molybdopterin-dependent oxidoreductase [Chitinophagaceae bacterium]
MKKILKLLTAGKAGLSTEQVILRKTIFSFTVFILLIGLAAAGWNMLLQQPLDGGIRGGIQEPLRKGLNINEKIFTGYFDSSRLVKEYPLSKAAKNVRVNGDVGLSEDFFDPAEWKLQVIKSNGDTLFIPIEEIKQLPKTDVNFNFKCIEGWSQVTHWGGVKFSDFIQKYRLYNEISQKYAGMSTPDEEYYVGIDMPSIMHPQTILCYEMNGKPLPMNQGFPLRLIIPVKYGIKHLKRIGSIYFSNAKPADYWAERGYDYHAGL